MSTLSGVFVAAEFDLYLHRPPARQSAPDFPVHVPNLMFQDPSTQIDCRIRDKGPHTFPVSRLLGGTKFKVSALHAKIVYTNENATE